MFTLGRYVRSSLSQYWRVQLAVALGVMVGAAVLTGALLIGDSVRNSLRRLTLERLGKIDSVLIADHFFHAELLQQIRSTSEPAGTSEDESDETSSSVPLTPSTGLSRAMGVILLPQVTLETTTAQQAFARRASQVTLLGSSNEFWEWGTVPVAPSRLPAGRQIVLNEPLAKELQVQVGDQLSVRLAKESRIAGDSTMAHKVDRIQSITELEVIAIIPPTGLGRFSLQANQALPRTAWIPLSTIQESLDLHEKINAILFSSEATETTASEEQQTALKKSIRPSLADAGLRLQEVQLSYQSSAKAEPTVVHRYWNLTTDSLIFAPAMADQLASALQGLTYDRTLTYLANSITRVTSPGDREAPPSSTTKQEIPYSTVSAIESEGTLSPLVLADGQPSVPLADDELALNDWAANDLGAALGDTIRLTYFEPETTHGEAKELSADFRLKVILPLTEPSQPYRRQRPAVYTSPPTRANDPHLTPEVPGITDQDSIDSWDPPFPFDYNRIRKPKDDDYWNAYRTTPKAFINWRTGQRLWQSRFGQISSFRIAAQSSSDKLPFTEAQLRERIERAIHENPESFGFAHLPLKRDGLLASRGTTPFQLLFLGFSLFLIVAAMMLVALLFRLGMEQRSREIGLLSAVGFPPRLIQKLFFREGLAIALMGAAAGVVASIAYAELMLAGLRTWWLDAVVTPFIGLHVTGRTLILGATLGTLAALLTIYFSLRAMKRQTVLNLMSGSFQVGGRSALPRSRRPWVAACCWGLALVLVVMAGTLQGEAQAGAFFGGGVMMLTALLWQIRQRLFSVTPPAGDRATRMTFLRLVWQNLKRNPGRSTLTLGLMATACFLIVAISAFRLSPTEEGTGAYDLMAQTDQPIFDDLNAPAIRTQWFANLASQLDGVQIESARLREGDDASCRNLYQVRQPRLIGLPDQVVRQFATSADHRGFSFAASDAQSDDERQNPWLLLNRRWNAETRVIPVILDKNTAMYSLQLYGGVGQEFELDYGAEGKKTFRIVGLLANSILQGSLLVGEEALVSHFPEVTGYRFFLLRGPQEAIARARPLLESTFSDQGMELIDTRQRLSELLAVQNTYLSTFQSLGGLGLLLGTFGLVAVQMRSVLERRSELALLRATGFSQRRIAQLVLLEHLFLLLGGLGIGLAAAFLTVLPQAWTQDVQPPWMTLAGILGLILTVGLITGFWILRPVLNASLVPALRGD